MTADLTISAVGTFFGVATALVAALVALVRSMSKVAALEASFAELKTEVRGLASSHHRQGARLGRIETVLAVKRITTSVDLPPSPEEGTKP